MSFLRPEALHALLRWREAAVGLGAAGLGVYWIVTDPGILRWVGVAFVLGGIAIAREGLTRARRPILSGGPGVVEVDERRITYLSADGGGAVSVDALTQVHIDTTADGPWQSDLFWVLTEGEGAELHIPGDAAGADQIFDALSPLPGVDYDAALAAMRSTEDRTFLVWRKDDPDKARLLH